MNPSPSPYIAQALALAEQALYVTSPNPRVGCVLTTADGRTVLGCGHTQAAGGPHAEIMALRDAQARGHSVLGATAYVTLEPCSHHGRTGPCCDALIAAGVARVVASLADPNPAVAGQGFARLRTAGVAVECGEGAAQSRALNIGFFSRMLRGTPWVRMKMAASLDGTTALANGASQWITSSAARTDGHAWRARACAILTGIGTVCKDRPRLDVRLVSTPRQPHLVVVDSQLQTPLDALFWTGTRPIFIYTAVQDAPKTQALEARGATVICMPEGLASQALGPRKVDLIAMLQDLGRRGINELHVEAGHILNGALLRAQQVDEFLLYLAPTLLGPGAGMVQWPPLTQLAQGLALHFHSVDPVGPDLRIVARVAGRDAF